MQRATLVIALTLATLACNDSTDPASSNIIRGRYTATTYTPFVGPDTFDLVADGFRLRITYADDSTLKGMLQLPEQESLVFRGAWLERDSTVVMKLNPPSLLEVFRFHHLDDRLELDTVLDNTRHRMVLSPN